MLTVGDLAPVIDERLGHALCPRDITDRALVKRIDSRCLANKVLALMRIFEGGGPGVNFQYMDPVPFPNPTDDMLKSLYEETKPAEERLLMRPETTTEVRQSAREYADWIVFAESVGQYRFTEGKMRVPARFIKLQSKIDDDDDDEDDGACPTEPSKIPIGDSCGGNVVDTGSSSHCHNRKPTLFSAIPFSRALTSSIVASPNFDALVRRLLQLSHNENFKPQQITPTCRRGRRSPRGGGRQNTSRPLLLRTVQRSGSPAEATSGVH